MCGSENSELAEPRIISAHTTFCNKLICWKFLYNCVGLAEASSDIWLKPFEIPLMCISDHDSLFVSSSDLVVNFL